MNKILTTVATMGSNLNVRYTPSLQGAIIGSIPNGSEVTVYANLADWALVGYGDTVGYVSKRYLL